MNKEIINNDKLCCKKCYVEAWLKSTANNEQKNLKQIKIQKKVNLKAANQKVQKNQF